MQIRSQYLIQDNHNDYTSEPLPSHGPSVSASSRVHTCAHPDTYLLSSFLRDAYAYPFHPLLPCLPCLPFARSCTLGSWKCLDAPRRPAGSRGKNATLLIIKYARDAVWEREGTVCVLYADVQCGLQVPRPWDSRKNSGRRKFQRILERRLFGKVGKLCYLFYSSSHYERECQYCHAMNIKWLCLNTRKYMCFEATINFAFSPGNVSHTILILIIFAFTDNNNFINIEYSQYFLKWNHYYYWNAIVQSPYDLRSISDIFVIKKNVM